MQSNYQKVNDCVAKTKPVYHKFYEVCLTQKINNMAQGLHDHADTMRNNPNTVMLTMLNEYYQQTLDEVKTHDEADYNEVAWLVLGTINHQLLIVNEAKYPDKVACIRAHFEYCCRQLLNYYTKKDRDSVLDCIYKITHNNRTNVDILVRTSPVLDLKNWHESA